MIRWMEQQVTSVPRRERRMKAANFQLSRQRRGLSRADVIVALYIVFVLIAVLTPAILQQRKRVRMSFCWNHIRNVGLALQNFASQSNGGLPLLTTDMPIQIERGETGTMEAGWPTQLLPALDATSVLKNIKKNAVIDGNANRAVRFRIADSEKIWIPAFTCPDDPKAEHKPGRLSYVVNAGFMSRQIFHGDPDGRHRPGLLSWDGNDVSDEEADIRVGLATGVIWRKSPSFQPSLDYVSQGDGTSNTLLLTENLQAGNWYDTDTARISFGLPVTTKGVEVPFGEGANFESVKKPLNTNFPGSKFGSLDPQDWRINSDHQALTGKRARPSSIHPGGVNVIFCSGSGQFLSDRIDPHVYVKLLTPNGMEFGEGMQPKGNDY